MSFLNKRPTHQWLKPLFDVLDGVGVQQPRIGSSTGTVGLYGATGIAPRLATGTAGITGWTGAGSSTVSQIWFNGGTGSFYTVSDAILALKNLGALKP
jgi:hypothetical protein